MKAEKLMKLIGMLASAAPMIAEAVEDAEDTAVAHQNRLLIDVYAGQALLGLVSNPTAIAEIARVRAETREGRLKVIAESAWDCAYAMMKERNRRSEADERDRARTDNPNHQEN